MKHDDAWPELPYAAWKETCATLHLWLQVVGKVRLAKAPWVNHSWHVTLYPSARGLTTSAIPHGDRAFELEFDFLDHVLHARTSSGGVRQVALEPRTVAQFHAAVLAALRELDVPVAIDPRPNEIPDAIPFPDDDVHAAYDPEYARRYWRVLLRASMVFQRFRARYLGKCSPVHFFWGSNDLAVTRFSGRVAPEHPGGVPALPDPITREAYSHEVSSAGFWPGGGPIDFPAFYSYAYPTPDGFGARAVRPAAASWNAELGEFLLPYDAVRTAAEPEDALLEFLQSTYEAAAETGGWDRRALERGPDAERGP